MGAVALGAAIVCCALLVVAGGVEPAAAADPPPQLRVTAGERSAEAFVVQSCRPSGDGLVVCSSAALAAGFRFPALAAPPGSELVIDTGLEATTVAVALSRPSGAGQGPAAPARRIDGRRWAFAMPSANARASIDVEYADGGSSSSLLTLRRIVADSEGRSSVDAYGDVVAWSERDGAGSQAGPYHLTVLAEGSVRRLPVASRPVPFDVDLGPDEDGRVVAVYSRCEQEPSTDDPGFVYAMPSPAYTRGEGCDIYRFDLATGQERKVAGASTDQASEMLPSIWGGSIAFARVYEQRSGERGRLPYLYVRPLAGGSSQRLPGGSRGASGLPGPVSLDLYGRRLSFVWNYATGGGSGDTGGVSEVRLDTIGGGHRVLSQAGHEGTGEAASYASYLSPQGAQGRIFYGYQRVDIRDEAVAIPEPDGGHTDAVRRSAVPRTNLLLRHRISTGDKDLVRAPESIAGVATTGRDAFYIAQRSDFLARDGRTAIIDVSDLAFP